jgi:hypothetical protein
VSNPKTPPGICGLFATVEEKVTFPLNVNAVDVVAPRPVTVAKVSVRVGDTPEDPELPLDPAPPLCPDDPDDPAAPFWPLDPELPAAPF